MIETIKIPGTHSTSLTACSKIYQTISRRIVRNVTLLPSSRRYNLTISHNHRFVWFRVGKVASRTIFHTLESANVQLDAEHPMSCHYPPAKFEDYFKFAFVRNPWDRLTSCWKNKVLFFNHFGLSESELNEMKNFENFVSFVEKQDIESCDPHIRSQASLIDLNNIDYIGRFEKFSDDLETVCKKIGINPIIEQMNKAKVSTSNQDIYSSELIKRVEKIYEKDINLFNYTFPK